MKKVRSRDIKLIRFQYVAPDLKSRAMVTHADFLGESLEHGIGLAKGAFSLNAIDLPVSEPDYAAESSEFRIVPDMDTFAELPYTARSGRFISELQYSNKRTAEIDPRVFLKQILRKAEREGYLISSACEAEFYLLQQNEGGEIIPVTGGDFADYYVESRSYDLMNDYVQELIQSLSTMGTKVERLKKEYGPSQIELILRYSDPVKSADDLVTLRDAAKAIAANRRLMATFLAKPFQDGATNGMHQHISLYEKRGKRNVFHDARDKKGFGLSETGYHFIGGIMKHIKEMTALAAPLPNSYKRLVPSLAWAPSTATYGYDNRGVAVRIPSIPKGTSASSSRVEYRVPDPTANPYLTLGVAIAAGLEGIKKGTDPGENIVEDPNTLPPAKLRERGIGYLPRTLGEAIEEMRKSTFLRKTLGDLLFEVYLKHRESEWQIYRERVTDWEVKAYVGAF
ncbi:MAG: glutamine synthetase family protein [Candidatus Geothermarchaeales archaeon]